MRRPPSYRPHKPMGQAVVTLGGRDHYLGMFGSPKYRQENQPLSEWLTGGQRQAGPAARTSAAR